MPPRRFGPARLVRVLLTLTVVLVAAMVTALAFGDQPISPLQAIREPQGLDGTLLFRLRLPRVLQALLVGAALAGTGAVLQALLRNPLAEPFVLGVSGGGALGATLALAAGVVFVGEAVDGLPGFVAGVGAPGLFAFLGAMAVTFLLMGGVGRSGPGGTVTVLLTGVIFNAFAGAAITAIQSLVSPERGRDIFRWLAGSLGHPSSAALISGALLQTAALGVLLVLAGRLNLLSLGDEEAASLGVPVTSTRRMLLIATSASVGGAVALSGMVGFVGLLVPHVLRRILGPDQRLLLPASILGGAAFLALADLAARLLFPWTGTELPVGVLTALLGGPFFLFQLRRRAFHG
ncbi:MAG TPA: iron ABC transporter permease [Myxococcaceae bacterium]|nr:iron ABC transporter permease [Myxococcaceae bacterium]